MACICRTMFLFICLAFFLFFKVSSIPVLQQTPSYIDLWPGGVIPYIIPSSQFNEDQQKLVRLAMNRWEDNTCIKFVPWTEDMGAAYIEFYFGGTCFSDIGMDKKQPQTIGISSGCMQIPLIAHEIGHAIGLIHTMRRQDRDFYVTVHYENIKMDSSRNFATTTAENESYNLYGTPYDYSSIMHYKSKTWSINGNVVLETKDPAYQSVIGHVSKVSFYDSKWVNKAYNCDEKCDKSKQCFNGGYVGGRKCQCICQDGFTGYHCEAPIPGYQKIISWTCPDAWSYANGRCYRIYPDVILAYSVALSLCNNQAASLVTFETGVERDWLLKTLNELKFTETTQSLWIGVKRNANDNWLGSQPFYQWLDGQTYNDSLMPIHDLAVVPEDNCGSTDGQYLSIGSCSKKNNRGFICMKDFDTACGGRFRLREGEQQYITSPGYPNDYTNSIQCQYVLQTRRDQLIEVTFEVFQFEITTDCQDDYLLVQNSALDEGKKYCGAGLRNKTLKSDGNLMILTFRSDVRNSDKGFKASINAIPPRFGGRNRGNPASFLSSFYAVSSNNRPVNSNSYLESVWNVFDSMSLSNILG